MAINPGGQIGELMDEVRGIVDDIDDGSGDEELRVSYETLFRYFNRGEREIAFRTMSLEDDSDATITPITITGNSSTYEYAISSKIIYIKKMILTSVNEELEKIRYDELRDVFKWDEVTGKPTRFVEFMDNKIFIYPVPTSTYDADTLDIEAVILPITDLSTSNLSLSIDARYEDALVDYVVSRYFRRSDSQTEDIEKSFIFERAFESYVGPPLSFIDWKNIKTQPEGIQFFFNR